LYVDGLMSLKRILLSLSLVVVMLILASSVSAQDEPTVLDIAYDDVVEDDLSSEAFFDWWYLQATSGDVIRVTMTASDGLAPLIGILSPSGDLVARSDGDGEAEVNGIAQVEYAAVEDGQHTIVATRVGNQQGTTTGHYTLELRRINPEASYENPYQLVEFPCEDTTATTVATLEFAEDVEQADLYRITVYGVDDFEPVILVNIAAQDFQLCNIDAAQTIGDTFTLPGEETRTVAAEGEQFASQLVLSGAELMGTVELTIAGARGVPGRYMAIIEGFNIADRLDLDFVSVRLGPLTADSTSLLLYMVATENSRLDPSMEWLEAGQVCDDAGRRDCADVPSIDDAGAIIHDIPGATVVGDRFDAGLLLTPGNPDPIGIELRAFRGDTTGDYSLVVIGELPPS
jgi:hypothetical protein